ncbi:hypothetical protein [Methylobacterium sp. SI9]|uniref:hypothetical protein n=1 Tax=Methylobacterium guangdongense TaxID=3138811 RepID=UPI00313AB5B6
MTEPVLWADLQVPGQPPVPLTTDQWDDNIAGLAARVAALEALRDTVPNLGDIAVASGGQAVSVPLTDGTGAGPHNLPLNEFNPAGAWAAGATYARGDLVTVGEISAVATAPHVASTYAADLKAGLWVQDTAAADWMTERGVYDPTVPYSVGGRRALLARLGHALAAVAGVGERRPGQGDPGRLRPWDGRRDGRPVLERGDRRPALASTLDADGAGRLRAA